MRFLSKGKNGPENCIVLPHFWWFTVFNQTLIY